MNRTEPTSPPTTDPTPEWGQSLATGAPGVALLHIEAARTGITGWDTVHQWASAMTRSPVIADPDASGLFHGAPAVAFALHTAQQPAYRSVLGKLDGHIAAGTRIRLDRAHQRIDHGRLPALREFDLISGLTGVGAYLLQREPGGELLLEILAYLVRLATEPLSVDGMLVPGWWSGDSPSGRPAPAWPGGHGNLGIAHGIAGPLALLAVAARRGVTVSGQDQAVEQICGILDRLRSGTGTAVWWPETVSAAEWSRGAVHQAAPGRPSWCYGTPGLARAQQLAALVSGDHDRQQLAEEALAGCLADDAQLAQVPDASLCHGWAGLLHTVRRTAADAGTGLLADQLPRLHARLDHHLNHHGTPAPSGLLEGPAGAELARSGLSSHWDACLLLDG